MLNPSVANRFCQEYGCVRLSIGEAIRKVILDFPQSDLTEEILLHLKNGQTVPDELCVLALERVLLDVQITTRGYVLCNFIYACTCTCTYCKFIMHYLYAHFHVQIVRVMYMYITVYLGRAEQAKTDHAYVHVNRSWARNGIIYCRVQNIHTCT